MPRISPVTCSSLCNVCRTVFSYVTTKRELQLTCDACVAAEALKQQQGTPKTSKVVSKTPKAPRISTREAFDHVTSDEDFIIAWNMSDSMDDLLLIMPQYNDPADNGKGRGRARNRAYLLRKDGYELKMMPK